MTEVVIATYASAVIELPGGGPVDLPAPAVQAAVEDIAFFIGSEGPSAYQVAVAEGFVGTEAAWLASLVGPPGTDGDDGAPGASAYQVAVAAGFVGSQAAWLASLVGPPGTDGDDGAPGASAYQVAVAAGFVGSQAAWLASLVGAPGTDGDDGAPGASAYQVAVAAGFVGTEAQWLASLVGPPGSGGATIAQTEIDFGPESKRQHIVDIAVAGVTPASRICAWQAGIAATGRDADENEMDQLHVVAIPGTGTIRLAVTCLSGRDLGRYIIQYQIA